MSRNSPNMSYCAFENTADALRQVLNLMYEAQDAGDTFQKFLESRSSAEERRAVERLLSLVEEVKEVADEWIGEDTE
jgi:negative regulator of replication initiation